MIKIYLGKISKLIENTKYDVLLNNYDETSEKRQNEKKAGEVMLLNALLQENIIIDQPIKYIYKGSKPYLKDYPYYYNISHTEDLIVLAISNYEVFIEGENAVQPEGFGEDVKSLYIIVLAVGSLIAFLSMAFIYNIGKKEEKELSASIEMQN